MQMRPQLSDPSLALGQVPLPEEGRGMGRGGAVWGQGVGRSELQALSRGHRCQVPALITTDSSEMAPSTLWWPVPDTQGDQSLPETVATSSKLWPLFPA